MLSKNTLLATITTTSAKAPETKATPGLGGIDGMASVLAPMDDALEFAALLLGENTGPTVENGEMLPLIDMGTGNILPPTGNDPSTDIANVTAQLATLVEASTNSAQSLGMSGTLLSPAVRADARIANTIASLNASRSMNLPPATLNASAIPTAIAPTEMPLFSAQDNQRVLTPMDQQASVLPQITAGLKEKMLGMDASKLSMLEPIGPANTALGAPALSKVGAQLATLPQELGSATRIFEMDTALGDRNWGREFSERVGWVINARLPSAQLKLNPEHLGPIEMSIEVDELQTRIQFAAPVSATREAIEQTLPRLREMLESQGLELQNADVGASLSQDRQERANADPADESAGPNATAESAESSNVQVQNVRVQLGLIDTFV